MMNKLREYCAPHLEVSLPRAFENAVYGKPRQASESFAEYLARMERCCRRLAKEGVELPSGASGYILYRPASLTESQDQRLLPWCDGSYDKNTIVKAIRKLDRVVKEKGSKANYVMDVEDAFEDR